MGRSFLQVKDKSSCSGCGACFCICGHDAIHMEEDSEGFLFPHIDKNKCVDCGLCIKVCPYNSDRSFNSGNYSQSCFAVTSKYEEYSLKSATIGLCTMIAEKFVDQNGVVYGVKLNEETWCASHVACYNKDDIDVIRNSKYIQSDTKETFKEVRQHLREGRRVLYIGTPCQIAGLKGFLMKDYDNLFTIDLICHGTYSYKLLLEEIKYWEKKFKGRISNFKFRSKQKYPWIKGGVINFDVRKENGKSFHIERHGSCSPVYRCYAYSGNGVNYNLRLSCYTCIFREKKRYGDLTIGDAWGNILSEYPFLKTDYNLKNGISLLICNTDKSILLCRSVSEYINTFKIDQGVAFSQPALLSANRIVPPERKRIYENIEKNNYIISLEDFFENTFDRMYLIHELKWYKELLKVMLKELLTIR